MILKGLGYSGLALIAGSGGYAAYDPTFRAALPTSLDGLSRFGRTSYNVLVTAADYRINLIWKYPGYDPLSRGEGQDAEGYNASLKQCNIRAARRLFRVCKSHGGIYNKFAQYISTLNHVLPKEAIDIISPLQDKAKQISKHEAEEAIKEELQKKGLDFDNTFISFDEEALAAASLAQVHHAVLLREGKPIEVALKIQYPRLKRQTDGDISTIRFLATVLGKVFPQFEYTWLVPEFEGNLVLELDFSQESRNGKRMKQMLSKQKDVYVPEVYDEFSTDKLLVMEYVDGWKISDNVRSIEEGVSPLKVSRTVLRTFGDMIHVHGLVHCDPHAGNLMLRKKAADSLSWKSIFSLAASLASIPVSAYFGYFDVATASAALTSLNLVYHSLTMSSGGRWFDDNYELVILDHGMYRRLEPEFRRDYCRLWKALLRRDEKLGIKTMNDLNIKVKQEDYDLFVMSLTFRPSKRFKNFKRDEYGRPIIPKEEIEKLKRTMEKVSMQEVNDFFKKLPRDLLFVMRTSNIIRSINHALGGTGRDRFRLFGESAVRGLVLNNNDLDQVNGAIRKYEESHQDLLSNPPYRVNLPVESEVLGQRNHMKISSALEIYRLRFYIQVIDAVAQVAGLIFSFGRTPAIVLKPEIIEAQIDAVESV